MIHLYYNAVRPHRGLNGKTPLDACGIEIEGENKWLTVIQNASKVSKIPVYSPQLKANPYQEAENSLPVLCPEFNNSSCP